MRKKATNLIFMFLALALIVTGFGPAANEARADNVEAEFDFWYALTGTFRDRTEELVDNFMEEYPHVSVDKVHRATYSEALTTAIAAYRGGNPPGVTQIYEVGTQTLLDSGAIVPVFELMDIDYDDFISPLYEYYSVEGEMYSLPFNSSTPVLYYNKDAFEEAGLDPEDPPQTFAEIEEYGRQLVESGVVDNALTAGWPAWTLLENMHTWHDQPIANNENGYADHATELYYDREFGVELLETFYQWSQEDIFSYEGREGEPVPSFVGQESAMQLNSTAYLAGFLEDAEFEVGTAKLPRVSEDYPRGNSLVGGATLWVFEDRTEQEYEAISNFLNFVSRTDNQAWWHRETGYLPVTHSAREQLEEEGWFEENPTFRTAFEQITAYEEGEYSGLRLGNFTQIRDIVLEELENMFGEEVTPQEAAENMVERGNRTLERYVRGQE